MGVEPLPIASVEGCDPGQQDLGAVFAAAAMSVRGIWPQADGVRQGGRDRDCPAATESWSEGQENEQFAWREDDACTGLHPPPGAEAMEMLSADAADKAVGGAWPELENRWDADENMDKVIGGEEFSSVSSNVGPGVRTTRPGGPAFAADEQVLLAPVKESVPSVSVPFAVRQAGLKSAASCARKALESGDDADEPQPRDGLLFAVNRFAYERPLLVPQCSRKEAPFNMTHVTPFPNHPAHRSTPCRRFRPVAPAAPNCFMEMLAVCKNEFDDAACAEDPLHCCAEHADDPVTSKHRVGPSFRFPARRGLCLYQRIVVQSARAV